MIPVLPLFILVLPLFISVPTLPFAYKSFIFYAFKLSDFQVLLFVVFGFLIDKILVGYYNYTRAWVRVIILVTFS